MAHYVSRAGSLAYLVPTASDVTEYASDLDGLLLHGGADLASTTYGEEPMTDSEGPRWPGDKIRDDYERRLLEAFEDAGKPVLGICRGAQIIAAHHGGALYQDIKTQKPQAHAHRDWNVYDKLFHGVELVEEGVLAKLYGRTSATINSIHHQAIKEVPAPLVLEARSKDDGIIEALRLGATSPQERPWVLGVQWHPEFSTDSDGHLDPNILMDAFLLAAKHGMPSI